MNLNEARQAAADAAYMAYDFSDVEVEDHGGWESTSPGVEMTRKVFIKAEMSENLDATEALNFTVRFASVDSAEVVEAYALTARHGCEVGFMPPSTRESTRAATPSP